MSAAVPRIDHEAVADIVCPWCGHVHQDSWEYGEGEQECAQCEQLFSLSIYRSVSYTTRRCE